MNLFSFASRSATALGILFAVLTSSAWATDFEQEPIKYSEAKPSNAITRLQERLDAGQAKLTYDDEFGYLPSVLNELKVSKTSQTLVFSKTSLQRQRIHPRTPRALYFNDDVYIGYCHNGDLVEISVADPTLGAVFYSLDQEATAKPKFTRHTDNCLICHGSSHTQQVPGHMVRSVYPDAGGYPILSSGTYRIDHTSPFRQRWGGWYVSGTHGKQSHLGNLIIASSEDKTDPENADNSSGQNVKDLSTKLNTSRYLTPHSDIVALMVLEHQGMAHNLLTRANFETRAALHYEAALNRELKQPADHRWDSTKSRIKSAAEPLVRYLLFSGEAPLTEQVAGTSGFAENFATAALKDSRGRSLRDFDLQTRLFKYPCSYLIYSPSFDALPDEVKEYTFKRIFEILISDDTSREFSHLSKSDRQAILEILRETKPNLPPYWKG